MKFSKKGRKKMGEFLCGFHRCVVSPYAKVITPLKFESDDFEGVVVLTRKEAAEILDFLSYLDMRGYRDSFLDGLTDCCKNLKDRIEKTEK